MSKAALSGKEQLWALAGVIPFLLSIGLLAFAVSQQAALAFAIGWPIIQVIGYAGAFKRSKGEIDHPLVKSQVFIHWMMLIILTVMISRAA